MTLGESIKRITRYIQGTDTRPRFVNVQNTKDLSALRTHFAVGNNVFLDVHKFSAIDELLNFDTLLEKITQQDAPTFLVELTTGAKLLGRRVLKQLITELAYFSKENCRTVVLCYQCEEELAFSDTRLRELVYFVEGETDKRPQIILMPEKIPAPPDANPAAGIHEIPARIEKGGHVRPLYVYTKKGKSSFPHSMLPITELNDAYDILCLRDPRTCALRKDHGTPKQWAEALDEISKKGSWGHVIGEKFGNTGNLEYAIAGWSSMNKTAQWFYFVALKLFGAKNNQCLHIASAKAESSNQLTREMYHCLLERNHTDNDFWSFYEQRKALLEAMGKSEQEAFDYCSLAISKGKDAIHYFTDGSRVEKEYIMKHLDQYGIEFGKKSILTILERVYPDLYRYLQPFPFHHETLGRYFEIYTYAKAVNKVLPELTEMMEHQAVAREYNILLQPRSELMDHVPKDNVTLYFVDAMGAEFVSYINEKCYQMQLRPTIKVARCNLPSITLVNKDFLDGFDEEDVITVKEIDDIKHKGKENYDYRITKQPLHLIRELEIIEELLEKARQRLNTAPGHRVFLVADHGATRMAVIMENTLSIDVNSKGTHSGRVCAYTEEVSHIPQAAEADGYYVLANYDRFKGGRKASVEAHGGATLEEVTVPVIELALVPPDMMIRLQTPIIQVSSRKKAEIGIFSKTPLKNVSVLINGKHYDAQTDDQHTFKAIMADIRRVGTYKADVFSEGNLVWRGLEFTVEREGFKEIDLF
jgi:hypothetical protein